MYLLMFFLKKKGSIVTIQIKINTQVCYLILIKTLPKVFIIFGKLPCLL